MYMYVYIYIYTYTCVYNSPELFCIAQEQRILTCTHTSKHTYIHTYIHTYMHACIYTFTYTTAQSSLAMDRNSESIHAYIHTYMHVFTRSHIQQLEALLQWIETANYTKSSEIGRKTHSSGTLTELLRWCSYTHTPTCLRTCIHHTLVFFVIRRAPQLHA